MIGPIRSHSHGFKPATRFRSQWGTATCFDVQVPRKCRAHYGEREKSEWYFKYTHRREVLPPRTVRSPGNPLDLPVSERTHREARSQFPVVYAQSSKQLAWAAHQASVRCTSAPAPRAALARWQVASILPHGSPYCSLFFRSYRLHHRQEGDCGSRQQCGQVVGLEAGLTLSASHSQIVCQSQFFGLPSVTTARSVSVTCWLA